MDSDRSGHAPLTMLQRSSNLEDEGLSAPYPPQPPQQQVFYHPNSYPTFVQHPQQQLDEFYITYGHPDYNEYMPHGPYQEDYEDMGDAPTRPRLTKHQVEILEAQFQANHKPNSMVKRQLAMQTNLSLPRVANRRAKAAFSTDFDDLGDPWPRAKESASATRPSTPTERSPGFGAFAVGALRESADESDTSNTTEKHLATCQSLCCPELRQSLRSHLLSHTTPEKRFRCIVCGKIFARRNDQRRHERKRHGSATDRRKATSLDHGSMVHQAEPADPSVPDALSTQSIGGRTHSAFLYPFRLPTPPSRPITSKDRRILDFESSYPDAAGDHITQKNHTYRHGSRGTYNVPATEPAKSISQTGPTRVSRHRQPYDTSFRFSEIDSRMLGTPNYQYSVDLHYPKLPEVKSQIHGYLLPPNVEQKKLLDIFQLQETTTAYLYKILSSSITSEAEVQKCKQRLEKIQLDLQHHPENSKLQSLKQKIEDTISFAETAIAKVKSATFPVSNNASPSSVKEEWSKENHSNYDHGYKRPGEEVLLKELRLEERTGRQARRGSLEDSMSADDDDKRSVVSREQACSASPNADSNSEGELSFIGMPRNQPSHDRPLRDLNLASVNFIKGLAARILAACIELARSANIRQCVTTESGSGSSTNSSHFHKGGRVATSTTNVLKRPQQQDKDDDRKDEEDNKRSKVPSRKHQDEAASSRLLSCPYFKYDPHRYSTLNQNIAETRYKNCASSYHRGISRVKQHLYRVHALPKYYCLRCYQSFPNADDMKAHAQMTTSCEVRVEALYQERMTENQFDQVHRRVIGGTPEVLWHAIFKILFPTAPRPLSPYISTTDPVALTYFVDLFRAFGPAEMRDFMRERRRRAGGSLKLEMTTQLAIDEAFEITAPQFLACVPSGVDLTGDEDTPSTSSPSSSDEVIGRRLTPPTIAVTDDDGRVEQLQYQLLPLSVPPRTETPTNIYQPTIDKQAEALQDWYHAPAVWAGNVNADELDYEPDWQEDFELDPSLIVPRFEMYTNVYAPQQINLGETLPGFNDPVYDIGGWISRESQA